MFLLVSRRIGRFKFLLTSTYIHASVVACDCHNYNTGISVRVLPLQNLHFYIVDDVHQHWYCSIANCHEHDFGEPPQILPVDIVG